MRQGGDGLSTTHEVDFISPSERHRCDSHVRYAAWLPTRHGRRASDNAVASCHLSSEYRHVCRSNQRELATWDVAPYILNWNVLVAKDDPWLRLLLHILHRGSLQFSEAPNVPLGILDVRDLLCCALLDALLYL